MKLLNVLTKHQEIHSLVFFISYFTVSVNPSVNTPESSSGFMMLIISITSSFDINKVNPFPALTAPFLLIYFIIIIIILHLHFFIAFEVKLLTNPCKLSLAKGITIFVS